MSDISLWKALSLFSSWEWSEIVAALLVSIGCIGEMYWLFIKGPSKEAWQLHLEFEKKRIRREKLFAIAVAAGVSAEVVTLIHGLPESIRLKRSVESVKSKNLVLQANIEDLRKKNDEIEMQSGPRVVSFSPTGLPKQLREKFPGIDVQLVNVNDGEARDLASQLDFLFQFTSWKVVSKREIPDWQGGLHLYANLKTLPGAYPVNEDKSLLAATFLSQKLNDMGIATSVESPAFGMNIPTNTIVIVAGIKPPFSTSRMVQILSKIDEAYQNGGTNFEESLSNLWKQYDKIENKEVQRFKKLK